MEFLRPPSRQQVRAQQRAAIAAVRYGPDFPPRRSEAPHYYALPRGLRRAGLSYGVYVRWVYRRQGHVLTWSTPNGYMIYSWNVSANMWMVMKDEGLRIVATGRG